MTILTLQMQGPLTKHTTLDKSPFNFVYKENWIVNFFLTKIQLNTVHK